ncbi:MAG TPA: hypothetical protein VIV55_10250 [Flavobacterium sp.]
MKKLQLHTFLIDKNSIDENTLQPIFEIDSDFSENEEYFRDDTLELGFENEAERCSKEIYDTFKIYEEIEDEHEMLWMMLRACDHVNNFIGQSSYYYQYEFALTETDFEYVVSLALLIDN